MITDPPSPAGSALVRSLQDDVGIAVLNMNTTHSVPNITNVREADNMFLTHNPFKVKGQCVVPLGNRAAQFKARNFNTNRNSKGIAIGIFP